MDIDKKREIIASNGYYERRKDKINIDIVKLVNKLSRKYGLSYFTIIRKYPEEAREIFRLQKKSAWYYNKIN